MINLNTPIAGQILMLVFTILFGIVALYGGYKITRPFNYEPKQKKPL
ncbi:MAG: hypothetical protein WCY19_04085 [Candidatus Gastranaerophilaceae bacterium]